MIYKGVLQTADFRLVIRPYLEIATTALVGLALLGGWAGDNWRGVLIIVTIMLVTIIWIGRWARLRGAKPVHVYLSAFINLVATSVIVIITGGVHSPFWLLFFIGAVASSMTFRGRVGTNLERLNTVTAALAFLLPEVREWPPDWASVTLLSMQVLTLFMSGLMIRKITTTVLESGEKFEESEERYRKLIDHARDVIFTTSEDGTITSLNPSFEVLTGWSRDDWLGRPFDALVAEEDRPLARAQFNRVLQAVTLRAIRLQIKAHSGEMLVVELNMSPQIKDGQVAGLLGIARDITEEKRAEEALLKSEERFSKAFRSNPAAMVITNMSNAKIIDVNESYQRLFEFSHKELIEHTALHLNIISGPAERQAMMKQLSENGSVHAYESTLQTKSREIRHILISLEKIELDGEVCILWIFYDITDRKRAEQTLQRQLREMMTLNTVATAGAEAREIDELIKRVTDAIGKTLYQDKFGILLIDEDMKTWKPHPSYHGTTAENLGKISPLSEDIAEKIVADGKPVRIGDLRREPTYLGTIVGTQSEMVVPIMVNGKVFGCLNVESKELDAFSEHDESLMSTIARSISTAIEKIYLLQTEKQRAQEASAIAEIGRDLSGTLQLEMVLQKISSHAKNLLRAETSAVYLLEPLKQSLQATIALGVDAEEIKNYPIKVGKGILGNIAAQKSGEIVNNVFLDPRGVTIEGTEDNPLEHIMGVPVVSKYQLTGLIAVWRTGVGQEFKSTELEFLNALAQQVAVAIENARLFEETQKRLREKEAVAQVSAAITHTLELEPLLENILLAAIKAIPASERGSFLLADEEENLHIRAVWGYTGPRVKNYSFPPSSGYSSLAFQERRAIVVSDVRADPRIRYEGDIPEMLTGGSAIAAPLIIKDHPIGVIAIDTPARENAFNEDDLHLLTAISASAALAIENARLFESTRHRLSEIEAVHTVSTALRSAQTLDEALPIILDQLMHLFNAGGASLEMLDPVSGEIVTELAYGAWVHLTGMRTPKDAGSSGQVVAAAEPYISVANMKSEELNIFGGLHTVACVPIIAQHQPIGSLWIGRQTPVLKEEVSLLSAIGEMIGNAIQRMRLHEQTEHLLDDLQVANLELSQAYDTTLEGWAKALELRDKETEGHSRRVTDLTMRLARDIGISEPELTHIHRGVVLHDIGKMGITDQMLRKTTPLTEDEWVEMRKHPKYAYDLLYPIIYLRPALDIPYCHHEKWDGTGYPRGLKGKQIPRAARIFAVVDVYDALSFDRPYRAAWPGWKVLNYLREQSGKHFDPEAVDAFLKLLKDKSLVKSQH